MVYAGSKGEIIQHTPTRDSIEKHMLEKEIVGLENYRIGPFIKISKDTALTRMPHFRRVSNGWTKMTVDEVLASGVKKNLANRGIID